jgi:hypothetical protein
MGDGHQVACHFAEQATAQAAQESAAAQSVIDTAGAPE